MKAVGPASSDAVLIAAFRHVFKNPGKDANTDAVLTELANFTGYFSVPPEEATALQYARDAGRREVFARISFLLGVSNETREAIQQAALRELEVYSTQKDDTNG